MEYRKLNVNHIAQPLSLLGFGLMRLPIVNGNNGQIDQKKGEELIDRALELGLNYFDTAYPYHERTSEAFVSRALCARHPRESFYLADKLPIFNVETKEEVDAMFENQLKSCGTDYFDFYLIHAINQERVSKIEQLGIVEKLHQEKQRGRIRHLGFSYHDNAACLAGVLDSYNWDFCQIQLNYFDWLYQDAKGQYEEIAKRGVSCMVMEPIRGGYLANLPPAVAEILTKAFPDDTLASIALRWVAQHPNVHVILSGMSSLEQLEQNAKTLSEPKPFTEAQSKAIEEAAQMLTKLTAVPCTGCRYCMDCPSGVDIPGMFVLYNKYNGFVLASEVINGYRATPPETRPDRCVACGACKAKCPQNIDIPHVLHQMAEQFSDMLIATK